MARSTSSSTTTSSRPSGPERLFRGGSATNEQLTAIVAAVLILLLAIERSRCSRSIRRTERVGLHKASFVVWLGATGIHVLAHLPTIARAFRARIPAAATRLAVVGVALTLGVVVATTTLPAADKLQDQLTGPLRVDGG